MGFSYQVLEAGSCRSHESVILRGAPRRKIRIPALFFVLEHPERGPIVVDTGYAPRIHETAKTHWSSSLYMTLIPVSVEKHESAAERLRTIGHDPAKIETVVITHFHPDHIAGLKDFPNARFHFLQEAYETIRFRTGLTAVRKGFFPGLVPADFAARAQPLKKRSPNPEPYDSFRNGVDILGDGSLRGIPLPGHAAGQMGVAFEDDRGNQVFLCADACWLTRSFQERIPPSRLTHWILESKPEFEDSFRRLCEFHARHPEVRILPSHCSQILSGHATSQ